MTEQDSALEKKDNVQSILDKITKDSFQYNSQDLSQDQRMDVNPIQLNTQNIHINLDKDLYKLAGKITGTTRLKNSLDIVPYVHIFLYFGDDHGIPVHNTTSDKDGNFAINDLPPGFYTLFAQAGNNLKYYSKYIKLLPGEQAHQSVLLK
ncbi:MAG: carboxypeptidase regulatory-like domain-containing protein [Clostridium sp.]|nr:carboxypeptidase regulatory-like domain-containing protein [Clostridium sp.]